MRGATFAWKQTGKTVTLHFKQMNEFMMSSYTAATKRILCHGPFPISCNDGQQRDVMDPHQVHHCYIGKQGAFA
jgi:hypothetical protein